MGHDGDRGEGWVVAQFSLLALLLLVPRRGPKWPTGLVRLARLAALPLLGVGGWLFARGFGDLGENLTPLPKPKPDAELVRAGVYAVVRHPIYGGLTLLAPGIALLTASTTRLGVALVLVAFFNAKADREEGWLRERFPDYDAYRAAVPKLLPRIW
jgi:protein-S-isoprenylcysteine O-methyltransferase Ste14